MQKEKFILCPVCGNKTRVQIREDTELKNFPLFCPKCHKQTLINAKQSFYKGKAEEAPVAAAPALDAEALASLLASNPELLKKALESVQLANNT